jgi:hypothetical protein
MEKHKGIILIKGIFGQSKSDGYKAYLITEDFKNYQLYRKDVLDINDAYFYPYHKKNVEIRGEIENDKWILVDSINESDDNISFKCEQKFESIKFTKPDEGFPDLINSEGAILSLVENKDSNEDPTNERLYLKGNIGPIKHIYTKVNDISLLLFFQGRLSVKELFMLRSDEVYIIEERSKQTPYYFDETNFQRELENIESGDKHYYSLPKDMRIEYPFEEVMNKLDLYWMNCQSSRKFIK